MNGPLEQQYITSLMPRNTRRFQIGLIYILLLSGTLGIYSYIELENWVLPLLTSLGKMVHNYFIVPFHDLFLMFFSLDQSITKNQISSTKYQPVFVVVVIQKEKRQSSPFFFSNCDNNKRLWLTLGVCYLVFRNQLMQLKQQITKQNTVKMVEL